MNILVTGSEGFIGSHLVEKLVKLGHKVKALVLYNSFNDIGWLSDLDKKVQKEIEICFGDIRDLSYMRKIVKNNDTIFHLAALIGIPYSYHSPKSYVDTNILGTLNILEAAKELRIPRMIHTSTSEVYGTARKIPISEQHPLNAQSPYSASKIAADQLVKSYYLSYKTPVITIRPFNTYGPRQSLRAIIPTIICQILMGSKKIKLGTITTTRDFSYITDTVSGFISTLNKNDKVIGETINIGSGKEVSIKDIISLITKITGKNPEIEFESKRKRPFKSEVLRLCSSIKKAEKVLGWKPKMNNKKGLILGLKKTIDWYNKKENLVKFKSNNYVL